MSVRRTMALVVVPVMVLVLSAGAFAAMKNWGNRLEGTADRLHGALAYELLGFFAYRYEYPLRDTVQLRLRFYLPGDRPFFVEAREIKTDKQYQMRPNRGSVVKQQDGWREFSGWPLSDVLFPNRIPSDNLGVIVRLDKEGDDAEELAPAVLLAADQAAPTMIQELVLYLTVRGKLKFLDYQVQGPSGYAQLYHHKQDQKNRSIESGTVIPLRFSAAPIPIGPAKVHITAPFANDLTAPPLDITYRFDRPR